MYYGRAGLTFRLPATFHGLICQSLAGCRYFVPPTKPSVSWPSILVQCALFAQSCSNSTSATFLSDGSYPADIYFKGTISSLHMRQPPSMRLSSLGCELVPLYFSPYKWFQVFQILNRVIILLFPFRQRPVFIDVYGTEFVWHFISPVSWEGKSQAFGRLTGTIPTQPLTKGNLIDA